MADNQQGQQSGGQQKPSLNWQAPVAGNAQQTTTPKPAAPKAPQVPPVGVKSSGSQTGMYVGIFVVGIIVGVALGWAVGGSRSGSTSETASSTQTGVETSSMSGTSSSGNVAITVDSPQPAGSTVKVSHSAVTKPTWVLVYDNVGGQPGKALGAVLFFPTSAGGMSSDTISLLRPTVAGKTYLVGYRLDDGNPNLSFSLDKPIMDENGKPLLTELKAQ